MMKVAIARAAVLVVGITMVFALLIASTPAGTYKDDDTAALYKSKCVTCHGANAEKKFDASMAEAEMVQIVLKGKKAEKPPNMPGYADKGITEDQAKALVAFMRSKH